MDQNGNLLLLRALLELVVVVVVVQRAEPTLVLPGVSGDPDLPLVHRTAGHYYDYENTQSEKFRVESW